MAFAYFQSLCSPNPSDVEDPYIQACMDEMRGCPNQFRQPIPIQNPVGTILEFLRQTSYQRTGVSQQMNQAVLNDDYFSLDNTK